MKIAQIFNRYLQRGGEEISVERISNALSQRHRVSHCYFDSRQMAGTDTFLEMGLSAGQMLWNFHAAQRLGAHLDAVKPDIVLLHNILPYGSAAVFHEVQKRGIPHINFIHNFRPFSVNGYLWARNRLQLAGLKKNFLPEIWEASWQNSRVRTLIAAAAISFIHTGGFYKRIDYWIAISNFMRTTFINSGIPENKVVTIRHSAQIDPVSSCISDQGYYLFLGRLISAKGVLTLLDAWGQLTKKLGPSTPVLKIAGEGELAQQVAAYCSQNPKVQFLGRVDGLAKTTCIQNCRAMIAPSLWWEPLGIVTYEAYNACKPMLAARSGGLTETVNDAYTGFLHEPGDVNQLVRQIEMLEANPIKAQNLGKAGREWLCENCNEVQWLDNFDRTIHNLLPEKN